MATIDLGKIKPIWKGDWAGSTAYEKNDMVLNGVNSYICTTAHTSSGTFSSDTANWDVMAYGAELPAQSGQAGKALETDGTNLSWGSQFKPLAWCVFDGGYYNAVQIIDSYNVSSITEVGTGNYQIGFTNALPDTDYLFSLDVQEDVDSISNTTNRQLTVDRAVSAHSTTAFRCSNVYWANNGRYACHRGYIMIFGDYE